jgi:hypothetical protein
MCLKRVLWLVTSGVLFVCIIAGCFGAIRSFDLWGEISGDGWPSTYLAEELARRVQSIDGGQAADATAFAESEGFAKTLVADAHLSSCVKDQLLANVVLLAALCIVFGIGAGYSIARAIASCDRSPQG